MSKHHTASSNQYSAADITHVWEQAQQHMDRPDIVKELTRPVIEAYWNLSGSFRFTQQAATQSLASLVTVFLQVADPKDALANRIRHKLKSADDKAFWGHRKPSPEDIKNQDFIRERRGYLRLET